MPGEKRERVLVLGTGFGAIRFAREVDPRRFEVTVVSPRNHFLFTPLLASTTVGTLEFRSVIESVRSACPHARYYQARARSVDWDGRKVACEGSDGRGFELEFESLVIAVGAAVNTFGIPGVREHARFLREAADARFIRQRILECFELASEPGLAGEERAALLHFVVVGGGPTGVEIAAEMHDLFHEDLRKPFSALVPEARITLLEAGGQILSSFDAALGDYTLRHFRRRGIDVRISSAVTGVEAGKVLLKDGSSLSTSLLVWATGNTPADFTRSLTLPKDKSGRIVTDDFLKTEKPGVYALGDCADPGGRNLPATAQLAEQEGKYLAAAFGRRARGRVVKPFRYRHAGMLAYIGGNRALADLNRVKGKGFSAFLFWRSAYFTKLVSMRNRILVLFDWVKAMLFGRDISRI